MPGRKPLRRPGTSGRKHVVSGVAHRRHTIASVTGPSSDRGWPANFSDSPLRPRVGETCGPGTPENRGRASRVTTPGRGRQHLRGHRGHEPARGRECPGGGARGGVRGRHPGDAMDMRVRTMAPSPGVGPLGHGRAAFFDSSGARRFVRRLLGQGHDIAPACPGSSRSVAPRTAACFAPGAATVRPRASRTARRAESAVRAVSGGVCANSAASER